MREPTLKSTVKTAKRTVRNAKRATSHTAAKLSDAASDMAEDTRSKAEDARVRAEEAWRSLNSSMQDVIAERPYVVGLAGLIAGFLVGAMLRPPPPSREDGA